jgi:hypothetical protein
MKKIISTAFLFGVLMFTGTSCTNQLDDIDQLGALATNSYYANATDNQALSLITSVYSSAWTATSNLESGSQSLTDDAADYGVTVYAGASTQTAALTSSFQTLYLINYKCNMIIENLTENTDAKKQVVGEAYFWRAWAYMNLIRGWGTPPLVDHVLTSGELQPSNGTPSALWAFVYSSLQEAINRLPSKAGKNGQIALGARVTKEAAYALLGKSYLLAGDKDNAVKALSEVVNSGLYGLLSNFSDLYTIKGDFSDEYLWEFNAQDDDNDNRATEARITYYNNWRAENIVMPGGCHLSGFNQGYSNAFASKDFYDFLVARGEKGKARQMGTVWSIDDAVQMFITLSKDEYKDSPNYEGNTMKALMDQGYTEKQAASMLLWGSYASPAVSQCEGYLPCKKYMWHSDMYPATLDKDLYSKANYPGMRYAEVLLLYAEAALGTSSESAGLAALNEVRQRAGLDALGTYTLQTVKDEKRAELWGEGERFFDVIRWGDAATDFANVGKYSYVLRGNKADYSTTLLAEPVDGWTGWQSKYALIPFPYSEMQLNPNLTQNPGWD